MIHCQMVRENQLDLMKEYGVFPSFFGMHCYYWGDWHRDSVMGAERAERISPAASALRRGMIFSQHHDSPVALPNAVRILSSVVTRRTRSGDILGAGQCIPVEEALKSLTLWAAYQHYEEANRAQSKSANWPTSWYSTKIPQDPHFRARRSEGEGDDQGREVDLLGQVVFHPPVSRRKRP